MFAGCEAPAWWCEVHHVLHWGDGGETCLENSALLCERHHCKVHHGFRIERDPDGRWHTYRPDGTEILLGTAAHLSRGAIDVRLRSGEADVVEQCAPLAVRDVSMRTSRCSGSSAAAWPYSRRARRRAPLGRFAWGGQHEVLPPASGSGSAVSIALYAAVRRPDPQGGRSARGSPAGFVDVAIWVLVGYFALGIAINAVSRSRPERLVMTPVVLVLAVVCLVLALP